MRCRVGVVPGFEFGCVESLAELIHIGVVQVGGEGVLNATNLSKLEKFGALCWERSSKVAVLDPIRASGLDDSVCDGKGCSKRRCG